MSPSFWYTPPALALDPWVGWLLVGLVIGPLVPSLLLQARYDRSVAWGTLFAFLWTLVVGVGWWHLRSTGLPMEWMTVVQEGCSDRSVLQLYLNATNVGPLHGWFAHQVSTMSRPHLPQLMAGHLALALATAGWFGALLAVRLRSVVVSLLLTSCFVLAPQVVDSALSEHIGSLGMAIVVLGLTTATAVRGAQHQTERWLAAVACLATAGLAAQLRLEWLVVALPVLLDTVAQAWSPLQRLLDTCWKTLAALLSRVVVWVTQSGLRVGVALLLWTLLLASLGSQQRWALLAIVPLSDWIEALPLWLVSLPLAVALAALVGTWSRLVHPKRHPWGLLAGLHLMAVYHCAALGVLPEWLRYTAVFVPALLWLAGIGWLQLHRWAIQRAWPKRWWWMAAAAAIVLTNPLTIDPWHKLRPGASRGEQHFPVVPTNGATQQELRWLWHQAGSAPHCVLVSRVAQSGNIHQFHHVVYGWPMQYPAFVETLPGQARLAVRLVAPRVPCVRYVRSWDCTREAAGCDADHKGAKLLVRALHTAPLYSDPIGYGVREGTADLSVYELHNAWQSPLWLAPPASGPDQVARQGDPSRP